MKRVTDYVLQKIDGVIPETILKALPEELREGDKWVINESRWLQLARPQFAEKRPIHPGMGQAYDEYVYIDAPHVRMMHGGFLPGYDWWVLYDTEARISRLLYSVYDASEYQKYLEDK